MYLPKVWLVAGSGVGREIVNVGAGVPWVTGRARLDEFLLCTYPTVLVWWKPPSGEQPAYLST